MSTNDIYIQTNIIMFTGQQGTNWIRGCNEYRYNEYEKPQEIGRHPETERLRSIEIDTGYCITFYIQFSRKRWSW